MVGTYSMLLVCFSEELMLRVKDMAIYMLLFSFIFVFHLLHMSLSQFGQSLFLMFLFHFLHVAFSRQYVTCQNLPGPE